MNNAEKIFIYILMFLFLLFCGWYAYMVINYRDKWEKYLLIWLIVFLAYLYIIYIIMNK